MNGGGTVRVLAEFAGPHDLVHGIRCMQELGWHDLETYSPIPLPEVDAVIGARRSRLPRFALVGGLLGASGAYFLQWLLNAYLYPLDVGGRPPHFPLAFVPITFEMGVLLTGLTVFFGVLVAGRLVKLWHPVMEAEGFESATSTGFWLEVQVGRLDRDRAAGALRGCGALRVSLARGEP